MWIQKEIRRKPRGRGFHIITESILKGIPELKDFKIGTMSVSFKILFCRAIITAPRA